MKELFEQVRKEGKRLNQHTPEWMTYLKYVKRYFDEKKITNPLVVEIGILDGAQRIFYEVLMGATYLGIDIDPKAPADIYGDSTSLSTLEALKRRIDGRKIDLLFIDGLHTYNAVKSDYEKYYSLVSHIIGIHDILTPKLVPNDSVDVIRFWEELKNTNKTDTLITIQHFNPRPMNVFNGRPLGIGLVIKGESYEDFGNF